jgi:hypothetical protein
MGLLGPPVGIQGKRQLQGRPLEAMEANVTADFRFGKETPRLVIAKEFMFISLKMVGGEAS